MGRIRRNRRKGPSMTDITERSERAARSTWPHLWDADRFEAVLAKLSIFSPEQAAESAARKREEKVKLTQRILEADAASGEQPARFDHVVREVIAEAERSIAKHGEQRHLPMGTGPETTPLAARPVEVGSLHDPGLWPGMRARQLARIATLDTKSHSANEGGDDSCTWWHILREEVLEAAAEEDPASLRDELIQVAAVAVKMIDALEAANG